MYTKVEPSDLRSNLFTMSKSTEEDPFSFLATVLQREWKIHRIEEIIGTWKRSDGTLLYATNQSHVKMYTKVPDYQFVGNGMWVKNK